MYIDKYLRATVEEHTSTVHYPFKPDYTLYISLVLQYYHTYDIIKSK